MASAEEKAALVPDYEPQVGWLGVTFFIVASLVFVGGGLVAVCTTFF